MNGLRGLRRGRAITAIALAGAAAVVMAGCSSTPAASPSDTSGGKKGPATELTLKLGSLLPQTGSLAFLGAPMEAGVALAVDQINQAKAGVTIDYSVPSQGAQIFFDVFGIPKDAPHVEEAHEFINYMMKPEVAAKASNFVFYANGNKASQEFLDKEVIGDTAIYPTPEVMAKLFTVPPLDPKTQRLVTRIWTKVVTGQ